MTRGGTRTVVQTLSLAGLAVSVALALWAWRSGLLSSQEAMEAFVSQMGRFGGVLFIALQAVQVVVPIIPGGLSCLAGVLLFGPVWGFVYNYIGICIGSLAAFAIARSCGRPLLEDLFPARLLEKYDHWTTERDRFARWLALAIFFPVAPDDFLCYLAGTTELSWRRFAAIILLGKPCSIALYSLGLTAVWQHVMPMLA